jgi:class 3 adenylate cyclase
VQGIALWDRLPGRGEGGTASMVAQMRSVCSAIDVLDPLDATVRQMRGFSAQQVDLSGEIASTTSSANAHQVRALLFGDVAGFSKFSTQQNRQFVEQVLPAIAEEIDRFAAQGTHIDVRNTWGDGLFLVLKNVHESALLALAIQKRLSQLRLPFPVRMRIALHYAPVMLTQDPISKRPNAIGPGVSRAARLEPATAPGAVYASEAVAALLALHADRASVRFSYLKNLPWAKGYGSFPTYLIE